MQMVRGGPNSWAGVITVDSFWSRTGFSVERPQKYPSLSLSIAPTSRPCALLNLSPWSHGNSFFDSTSVVCGHTKCQVLFDTVGTEVSKVLDWPCLQGAYSGPSGDKHQSDNNLCEASEHWATWLQSLTLEGLRLHVSKLRTESNFRKFLSRSWQFSPNAEDAQRRKQISCLFV